MPQIAKRTFADVDVLRLRAFEDVYVKDPVLRAELAAKLISRIGEMGVMDLQGMARFLDILDGDTGATSPAEEFISSLVAMHYRSGEGRGLTPDQVELEVQEFRKNFQVMKDAVKRFGQTYGDL